MRSLNALRTLNREYYGNVLLLAPDGSPLSTVGKDRAQWYLSRNLAVELESTPDYKDYEGVVQLNFMPKRISKDPFHTQLRQSRCVVCGISVGLTLHHVIPISIRRHFPVKEKTKQAAWCVLVCTPHHLEAEEKIRKVLKITLPKSSTVKFKELLSKSALWHILDNGKADYVRTTYPQRWAALLQEARITEDQLETLGATPRKKLIRKSSAQLRKINRQKQQEWVTQYVENAGGIPAVKQMFKDTFLQLKPKFLPKGYLEDHL